MDLPEKHITSLTPVGEQDGSRRMRITVNNQSVGTLSAKLVAQLGLQVGQAWTEELALRVRGEMDYDRALSRAVKMIGRRPRSSAEIDAKLRTLGWPEELLQRVWRRLHELGLLDDAALARQWVEEWRRKGPLGPELAEAKLRAKGFAEAVVSEVTKELTDQPGTDTDDATLAWAQKKLQGLADLPAATQYRRLMGLLARRGLEEEQTREIMAQLGFGEEIEE